ncbi:YkyB family protein [Fictibacillus terranigra]|uniref:YkyB family protein n=1 Tax=Fictibacillus terranigra TaxID=3058424 RepID=UPI00338E9ADD
MRTAPGLYQLKKKAILKLLEEGKAKKFSLNLLSNPCYTRPQLYTLVSVDNFYFHIPVQKEDKGKFKVIPIDTDYRNPKIHMSLKQAKKILETYGLPSSKSIHSKNTPKIKSYKGFSPYLNG